MVDEPDELSAISILRGLKERYENHHKVPTRWWAPVVVRVPWMPPTS
jgi:ATP-dependent Clp protease ATP-binding subunit ClpA